jgi:2-C-methyl-D-erythritol 4-phosphate cytidylyltransferase
MLDYESVGVVIAAGGSGDRFGGDTPKQFLDLEGEAVVIRALRPFLGESRLKMIAVAVPAKWMHWMGGQVESQGLSEIVKIVPGGAHRGASVFAGLKVVQDTDVVHIHDAVRPFASKKTLKEAAQKAWEYGGAVVAVRVKDSLKKESDGLIVSTIDRERIWRAQTPQTFRTNVILKAYKIALNSGFQGSDDAILLEKFTGIKVKLIPGTEMNFKITTEDDFQLARAIIRMNKDKI